MLVPIQHLLGRKLCFNTYTCLLHKSAYFCRTNIKKKYILLNVSQEQFVGTKMKNIHMCCVLNNLTQC